jgi:hypothetical protein
MPSLRSFPLFHGSPWNDLGVFLKMNAYSDFRIAHFDYLRQGKKIPTESAKKGRKTGEEHYMSISPLKTNAL